MSTHSVVVGITAAAFVGLTALAGQWVARQGAAQPSRFEASARAALAPVDVTFPSEWRRLPAKAAGIAGIERQPTLVFEPAPGLPALAVLTLASLKSVGSPSLLPEHLRGAARIPLGRPRMVRLDGRRAWSYTAGPVRRGRQMMDITVLPTTAGVVTIACTAPELMFYGAAAGCESRLRLTLKSARAIRPTRDLGFRLRLGDVVRRLDLARVQQRARLLRARTPEAQARAARRLATAHSRAARALAPLVVTGASAEMVALLRESSRGYERLSKSATAQDGKAFALASRAVNGADRRLGATYGEFRADQRVRPPGE